jgi:hypothetical protein
MSRHVANANLIGATTVDWDVIERELSFFDFEGRMQPTQFADLQRSEREWEPEQKLLLSVGLRAFLDAYSPHPPEGLNYYSKTNAAHVGNLMWAEAHACAHEWIASDAEGEWTFRQWCEEFGLEPKWVRKALRRNASHILGIIRAFQSEKGAFHSHRKFKAQAKQEEVS